MKVICDRGALLDSLNLASRVIVARTPKPVLTCVKLDADDQAGHMTLSATDMEASLRITTARVDIQEPGQALIPVDKLRQIVNESVDPTITIETEDEAAHIRSQDSHFKVFGYKVDDFPDMPVASDKPDIQISAGALCRLISQTIFATARESSRYAINGVLLELDGKKITVVATDGRRLAMSKGSCKSNLEERRAAIVPTKALNIILSLFHEPDQVVDIRIADNQIVFSADQATLTSNLVEGSFPPYDDVIPKENDRKATIATDVLASAVRRAALLTNEESKGVRLAFDNTSLKLSSRAPEMGEAEIDVDVPEFTGEPIEIGFNPQFITEALKVVDTDMVSIEMKAPNKPGLMRTGSDFTYVIMPVNLQ